ncbi:MAG: HAD-IA family hydrolase [Pseudomonadota bacterium]
MAAEAPEALIFDVGNVLLRWEPAALVGQVLPEVDAQRVAQRVFASTAWHELDAGRLQLAAVVAELTASTGLSEHALQDLFAALPASLTPIAPMHRLAHALADQRIPIYVLSNMPAYAQAYIVEHHSIFARMAGCVFSNEVQAAKPEPEIFETLLERFSLVPSRCLFIDDSLVNLDTAGQFELMTAQLVAGASDVETERLARSVAGRFGLIDVP